MNKFAKYLPWFVIAVGIILRLREYLSSRSLWVDEAFIALNIIDKPFLELLKPLRDSQHAPYGFLWIERFLFQLFGSNELVFRLFPLVCGIISLFLFKKLVDRLFDKPYANLSLFIFAFSDLLIRYTTELKQYSAEVMVNLVLYLMAMHFGLENLFTRKWKYLLVVGVVSFLFSHTSVLTLIAFSLVSIISLGKLRQWKKMVVPGILLAIWPMSFVLLYLEDLTQAYANTFFLSEWPYFYIIPTNMPELVANLDGFYGILYELLGNFSVWVGFVLFPIGIYTYMRSNVKLALIFILPLVFALGASGLHKYPYVTRVFLFSIPTIIICVTWGVKYIADKWKGIPIMRVLIFSFIAVGLLVSSFYQATIYFFHPREIEEIKPVLTYYQANRQKNDFLYVYYAAKAPFYYYAPRFGFVDEKFMVGTISRENWLKYITEINQMRGHPRVWFLFSHAIIAKATPTGRITEEEYITNYLDKIGKQQSRVQRMGASIYLYSF